MRGGAKPRGKPPSSSRKDGFEVHHTKDCIVNAEHAALRDITKPRPDLIWRTAWGEVRSMVDAAIENFHNDPTDYNRGRMNALADASERLLERYVKA